MIVLEVRTEATVRTEEVHVHAPFHLRLRPTTDVDVALFRDGRRVRCSVTRVRGGSTFSFASRRADGCVRVVVSGGECDIAEFVVESQGPVE